MPPPLEVPTRGAEGDLRGVVARLGLEAWADQLAREGLDLEALALASPADLRATLGMPLGLAIKLVKAASQAQEGDTARVTDDTARPAGAFRKADAAFAGTCGPEPEKAGQVRRGRALGCGRLPLLELVKQAWQLRGKFTLLDFILLFKDHTILWKECLVLAADDETLKADLIAACGMWTTCMSLWLGVITSFLGIDQPDVDLRLWLVFEVVVSVASFIMFLTIILWCIILLCLSATHASRVRGFVLAAMAPLQVAEYFFIASVYLCLWVFLLLAQLRIWQLAPALGNHVCRYAGGAVAAVSLSSLLVIAVSIYVLTNVTCLGGVMGPSQSPARQDGAGGPQRALQEASDQVWRQVGLVRSRADALSLYWRGGLGGNGFAWKEGGAGTVGRTGSEANRVPLCEPSTPPTVHV